MHRVCRIAIVAAVAVAGSGGCKSGPSDDQCKQLLEHLVDLEFAKAGAAAPRESAKAESTKAKAAVVEAKASAFMDTCKNKMARSRVVCALAATSLDGEGGVAKCDEAK